MNNEFFQSLACLSPPSPDCQKTSCSVIFHIAKELPFETDIEQVQGEWLLLQSNPVPPPTESTRIDSYRQKFLELKTPSGETKYQTLGRIIRAALLLCHGSADVERGFSRSALLMTSLQACTEERTLNAKAFATDALRDYENRPERVLITKKLLCLARSAMNYSLLNEDRKNHRERSLKLRRKMLNKKSRRWRGRSRK